MKQTIEIRHGNGEPSKIVIGEGVLASLGEHLPARRVIIITDSNVHRRYMQTIDSHERIIIGMGETNKTLITADRIYRELIAMRADRDCFLLGFGGGIVTDITGFVASTYMRGLPFGFVSTTLLGQVDASVGGKNGVNVDGYKNMVGTFNQPAFVLCDTTLLKTLPEREFRSGLAEVVKAGVIADRELFSLLESHTLEDIKTDAGLLAEIITRAIRVKADIVERDERESGERRKLNLGHTFGHALERITESYTHGEAVAIGTAMAAEIAVRADVLGAGDAERIKEVLSKLGLPMDTDIDRNRLAKGMRSDKKSEGDNIYFVLPTGVGSCEVRKMAFEELESLFHGQSTLPFRSGQQ